MARDLSVLMAKILERYAVEPIVILEINWGTGDTQYYSTRTIDVPDLGITKNTLLEVPYFKTQVTKTIGTVDLLDLTLDDADGDIKVYFDTINMEDIEASLHLFVVGSDSSVTLVSGNIRGPISWDEKERIVHFSLMQGISNEDEIGYIPSDLEINELITANNFVDNPSETIKEDAWPITYGSPLNVPALRLTQQLESTLKTDLQVAKYEALIDTPSDPENPQLDDYAYSSETVRIANPEIFPPSNSINPITFVIDAVTICGYFPYLSSSDIATRETFIIRYEYESVTYSGANVKRYIQVEIGSRDTSDVDHKSDLILWLKNPYVNLVGLACQISKDDNFTSRCTKQVGTKCWFDKPFYRSDAAFWHERIDSGVFNHCALYHRANGWEEDTGSVDRGNEWWEIGDFSGPFTAPQYWSMDGNYILHPSADIPTLESYEENEVTTVAAGSKVRYVGYYLSEFPLDGGENEVIPLGIRECYVITLDNTAAAQIIAVKAQRKTEEEALLQNVPNYSDYYNIDTLSTDSQTATVLKLFQPLSHHPGEGWSDEIFVTLRAPIQGPTGHVSEVLKDIITKWGPGISIDDASFDLVKTITTNNQNKSKYPVGFALLEKKELLSTLSDIAWQARCALLFEGGIAYLKYLALEDSIIETITEDDILINTLERNYESETNLLTKITATWQESYAEKEIIWRRTFGASISTQNPYNIVYKNNQDIYGIREDEWDFWIYNIGACVAKSLEFWGNRRSHPWKKLRLKTFLHNLTLQVHDIVNIDVPLVKSTPIKGVVTSFSFNPETIEVNLEIELSEAVGGSAEPYWFLPE